MKLTKEQREALRQGMTPGSSKVFDPWFARINTALEEVLMDDLDELEAERDKLRLLVQEQGHEEYCLMGAGPCWVCNAIKETNND